MLHIRSLGAADGPRFRVAGAPVPRALLGRAGRARCLALGGLALLLALPGPARATTCGNSTVPSCVNLVGSSGGVAAGSLGRFQVVVRDCANFPVAGAVVVVDLSGCPELHFCADQRDAALVVNCGAKTVTGVTAADGSLSMTLLGGSNGAGHAQSLLGALRIYANGTLIGSPTVSAFDLDGGSGVAINDLSVWLGDFGSGINYGRSDFDCNGSVGANDLAVWLGAYGSGAQIESCAANCP